MNKYTPTIFVLFLMVTQGIGFLRTWEATAAKPPMAVDHPYEYSLPCDLKAAYRQLPARRRATQKRMKRRLEARMEKFCPAER